MRTSLGRLELHQTTQFAVGEGVVAGGAVGLVAGLLLGGPVGGALLGMLGGGALAARDTGLPDDRLRALGASLVPGEAAVAVLVTPRRAEAVRTSLARYGAVAEP